MVKRIRIFPFKSPFKRKKKKYSDYVIDLGKLKDKGIIKEPIEAESITDTSTSETTAETGTDSGLGFLGSLASASSESESSDSGITAGTASSSLSKESEEKLDMISDRVYKLIERVDLLEHKINRIEKKLGVGENY